MILIEDHPIQAVEEQSIESIVGFVLKYLNDHATEMDVQLGMFLERKADIIKELKNGK